MKTLFVAGSRKFHKEIKELVKRLEGRSIKISTAGKWNAAESDALESERAALLRAFKEIDKADMVYIYSAGGYVGKTVAMEIAYAYARAKVVVSSERIEELSARALVSRVVKPEQLPRFCQSK